MFLEPTLEYFARHQVYRSFEMFLEKQRLTCFSRVCQLQQSKLFELVLLANQCRMTVQVNFPLFCYHQFSLFFHQIFTYLSEKEVNKITEAINEKSRSVVKLGKRFIQEQQEIDVDTAYSLGTEIMVSNLKLKDAQEGIKSFSEKRKPSWSHNYDKASKVQSYAFSFEEKCDNVHIFFSSEIMYILLGRYNLQDFVEK